MEVGVTPIGALARGMFAGAFGSFVQTLFLRATTPVAPSTPRVSEPPEDAQREETPTQTVARRWVDDFMQRGPLSHRQKRWAGEVVHYAFGAAWGMDYALVRESVAHGGSVGGAIAFGTVVWVVSDNAILPAFKLSAPPTAYPVKNHAYAWAAHVAYGLAVWGAYEAMRHSPAAIGAAVLGAARLRARRPPTVRERIGRAIEPMGRALSRAA
jgi:uncharacterized membrane protein YagU involved in acid resistance